MLLIQETFKEKIQLYKIIELKLFKKKWSTAVSEYVLMSKLFTSEEGLLVHLWT